MAKHISSLCTLSRTYAANSNKKDRAMLRVIECFVKSLSGTQDHWKWYHSKTLRHGLLFAFHSNYGHLVIISETKRNIGRKSQFFSKSLHSMSPLQGPRPNITMPFGVRKLEWCSKHYLWVWIPDVLTSSFNVSWNLTDWLFTCVFNEQTLPSHFDRMLACDGWTYGQT